MRRERRRDPQRRHGGGEHDGEDGDPRLALSAPVGKGAEKRAARRDQNAGGRRAVAPQRLPARAVADDGVGEVGREQEGQDQRVEGLHGPVEQHPRDAGAQRRAHSGVWAADVANRSMRYPRQEAPGRHGHSTKNGLRLLHCAAAEALLQDDQVVGQLVGVAGIGREMPARDARPPPRSPPRGRRRAGLWRLRPSARR